MDHAAAQMGVGWAPVLRSGVDAGRVGTSALPAGPLRTLRRRPVMVYQVLAL